MMRALAEKAIPQLYPKLEMGSRELKGEEVEEFLKQSNLGALPELFHAAPKGLNLVVKEGGRFVPNIKAEIAQEILDYLKREHSYGEKVTGAKLLEKFCGLGYGWSPDIVRLVTAVLFRAGAIEVATQGRRFRNYQEPAARSPFLKLPEFRSAGFSPRESIDLKTLTRAVRELEEMVGHEVDVEESAIAEEFRKLAQAERERTLPLLAKVQAHNLRIAEPLKDYLESLEAILNSQSDDCVRMLAGEGKSFREQRERAHRIESLLTENSVEAIRNARAALNGQAPLLAKSTGQPVPQEATLRELLDSEQILDRLDELKQAAGAVDSAYRTRFEQRHKERFAKYQEAIDRIRASADYRSLASGEAEAALEQLSQRAVRDFDLPPFAAADALRGETLASLEQDLGLLPTLEAGAVARLRNAVQKPDGQTEVIRLSEFLPVDRPLGDFTDEEIEAAIERLKQKLYTLRELKRRAVWD
jgi:hypothetical protein